MKLLQRANRIHLIVTGTLLLLAGIALFFMILHVEQEEVTEKLLVNLERVADRIRHDGTVPHLPPVIEVVESPGHTIVPPMVKDTMLFDPQEQDEEYFREVTGFALLRGTTFRITVRQVVLEPHDYLGPIGGSLAAVLIALLVALLLINHRINTRLWRPFHRSLSALKAFNMKQNEPLELDGGNTAEFEELNSAISDLADRVRADYGALKEFTANAAHEMQTPVAAVLNNLEQAMQAKGLTDALARDIGAAHGSAQRLSKLHQALLVLARIENRQFTGATSIDLDHAINEQLEQAADFIAARAITVDRRPVVSGVVLNADPALLALLLANLIGNAVKHNIDGGTIRILVEDHRLLISNTGPAIDLALDRLFERFTKGDPTSASLGLGLSIVRAICEASGWSVVFKSEGTQHRVIVGFT